ncbi:MAG: SufE family protein [Melioribacteraceae bacterium]|nr:SufE family protein [Melioribacteraceae bacterium]
MSIAEIQAEIIKEFEGIDDWDEKYTKIIKMGRELPEFPEELKTDKNKLDGCQSQVWTNAELKDGKILIKADSDAMIVKGLIALVLKVYSGHEPSEILSSPPDFITKIGIDNHLSPTRKNGLGAMLKQIQMYAVAFKALSSKM